MSARILVVDDNPSNVKLLKAKLSAEYYDILTAQNGKQAIEVLKNNDIDLVLLDVMMPEMDGFEACRIIKSDEKMSNIPVVMVTALTEVKDRVKGIKSGADDFVTKPIVDISLFARIRNLSRLKSMMEELKMRGKTGVELGGNPITEKEIEDVSDSTILIIEDDEEQAARLKATLSKKIKNIEIVEEYNGQIPNKTDLVIISSQLIAIDALRICVQIKGGREHKFIPIIILVEEEDEETLVKALDIGVSDYIYLPINEDELILRSSTQVRKKRYRDVLRNNYQLSMNMATTDPLTGLYNRFFFDAYADKLLESAKATEKDLSLLMIDIDDFKVVNDSFGHLVGDEVLKRLSGLMKSSLRSTDIVARFGGDELIILLADTNIDQAKFVAERLRKAIEQEEIDGARVSVSIGCASLEGSENIESLLSKADKAMYEAKKSGKNSTKS